MEQQATSHKILIIDDEEHYRSVIALALGTMGYEVVEATNGVDGLAAAKRHHPDLILCDINMPKMDGHDLLRALKGEQEFAGIPFIFLTGNAGPSDLRKGMQLGADDYLTKPFSAEDLISAVETRLAKKKTIEKYFASQFDDIKSSITLSLPHEYRTPLNGILGFSQMLMEESSVPPDEVKQIGGMIYRSAKRLHRLLENMVLFGQLQLWSHDQEKITELRGKHSTNVDEILSAVVERMSTVHDRPGNIRLSIDPAAVRLSSMYLMKIVEEILDNALKFSEPGSPVECRCFRTGETVTISVKDSGRGMSEDQIKKISGFQQFERGYYEQQGAGLGLAVAKLLTDIHGGQIAIESAKNAGTTVTIVLPSSL